MIKDNAHRYSYLSRDSFPEAMRRTLLEELKLKEEVEEFKTLKTEVITDDELPYRIAWGRLKAAGDSPGSAMVRMLSLGGYIPADIKDRKKVARYIFWNYQAFTPWANVIHILDTDCFD